MKRPNYQSIIQFITRLKKLEASGFDLEATIMVYVGIDLMCKLSLDENKERQTRLDFIKWVDSYMKADPEQPYQYRGIDLYAARCGLLHNYSSIADIHKNDDINIIAYHDGGKHMLDKKVDKRLVLIGMKSLINDFILAVNTFLNSLEKNTPLRKRVETHLNEVFSHIPIQY